MRKRWKVFWIVCAVFAVTGLFLIGAGAVMGGFRALRDREERWIADFWEDDSGQDDGLQQNGTNPEGGNGQDGQNGQNHPQGPVGRFSNTALPPSDQMK